MKRRDLLLGLATLPGCRVDRRPRLNVFSWSDYVAPNTISNFEVETGVSVRYAVYESAEEMLAKVLTGNSGWDVVFPSNAYIAPMRELGLLARLEHNRLTGLDHLESRFRAPGWDPQLDWCVPYMWGATGILYQRRLTPAPGAWADLWETRLRGSITMLDDPAEVIGACLLKLGLPVNSTDAEHLRRAQREAIEQKRLLRAYLNAEARDQMVSGDLMAAQGWGITAAQAMDASPKVGFVYPAEGFPMYSDCAVVLRESRRTDLAHRFIDYLLRPAVSASIVAAAKTATCNASARALLSASLRDNPALYPPPDVLSRGQWFESMPATAQRLRDRLWTEIKSA